MKKTVLLILAATFALSTLISLTGVYFVHQQPTEEEKVTTLYTYLQEGKYDYVATLKPNYLYNRTTLHPEEGTLYIKITESLNITFTYTLNCSLPSNITLHYQINRILRSPQWPEKTITILPLTVSTLQQTRVAAFSANHYINITSLEELKTSIDRETGTYTSEYSLTVQPHIQITANTTEGTVEDAFTPELVLDFRYRTPKGDYIAVEGLTRTQQGSIQHTETVHHPEVISQRHISYALSIGFTSALLCTAIAYVKSKPKKPVKTEKTIEETMAPYEETIFELAEEPHKTPETTTVKMNNLSDLISIADGLAKPILHMKRTPTAPQEKTVHVFYVLDGSVAYENEAKGE